jgi:hypothetical protein
LSSVTHKLRTQGVFTDLGKMQGLLDVAKKDVVLDAGWNVLDFARQARGLTGGNVEFHTLPIERYALVHGQDVNIIDSAKIKSITRYAFSLGGHASLSTETSTPLPTVDVLNGGGTPGLAARIAGRLTDLGYVKGGVGNGKGRARTVIRYGNGAKTSADKIAAMFGVTAGSSITVPPGHVRIELGRNETMPDTSPVHRRQRTTGAAPIPTEGAQGGAVTGGGIPCVD